ncbi:hypothetical protein ACFL0C_00380 [Patescibacteria group bacterium]
MAKLKKFLIEGALLQVRFVETENVVLGVTCDVYAFVGDTSKDLGIINIAPGCKTPLQRVKKGTRTVEGYVKGKGTLTKINGEKVVYTMSGKPFSVDVQIGEVMQWEAAKGSHLIAYEICFPPYADGRFDNLPE